MRCKFDDVTFHATTGEYRNGPEGYVWIPEYEARDAVAMGNWEKLGEYKPPEKLRRWA